METKIVKEVVLDSFVLGTTDVMKYADEHPEERFSSTTFRCKNTHDALMVSDMSENDISCSLACFERGIYTWHECPNGWQRHHNCGWLCHKDGRYIFITN